MFNCGAHQGCDEDDDDDDDDNDDDDDDDDGDDDDDWPSCRLARRQFGCGRIFINDTDNHQEDGADD